MSFRFTEEDFERYVKQSEHGGKHIWHYLQDRLEEMLGIPFITNPFIARGDRLQTLWIVPRETPRPAWPHQAMFYLARSIEDRELTFGLSVECPSLEWAEQEDIDTDRDGMRLVQRLKNDQGFQAKIDQLASSSEWRIGVGTENTTKRVQSSEELLDAIAQIPEHQYWAAYVHQKMSAEEAIAAGDMIVDRIMEGYQAVLRLWEAIIPEADRKFVLKNKAFNPQFDGQVWLFQANPEQFNLAADLVHSRAGDHDRWSVNQHRTRLKPGDRAILWQSGDNAGIYAIGELESEAYQRDWEPDEEKLAESPYLGAEWWVDFRYLLILDHPVSRDIMKNDPDLQTLGVLKNPRATNYRVELEEWDAIKRLIERMPEIAPTLFSPPRGERRVRQTPLPPEETYDMMEILTRALTARGFHFTPWQIATFYTALQTKGFVILSGISGTGKTKLAQTFAEILPQPARSEAESRDDLISITVQPYMLKSNRLTIPKHYTRLYEPPPRGESVEVALTFGDQHQKCRLHYADYDDTNYIALYLKGEAPPWFRQNFEVGDTVVLEPRSDQDGRLLGFHMGIPSDPEFREETAGPVPSNNLFIPVRTDWRDSKSLLGYYNPLTGTYEWTEFLRFLLRSARSYRRGDGLAWFIILDEMNLARVEYYFADLLSVLESGRDEEGWTRESLRLPYPADAEGDLPPTHVKVPPNLYVIGTVNVDETTHTFSPKVLDRAFTLELTEADFSEYPPTVIKDEETALTASARHAILANFTQEGQFVRIDKTAIATYVQETSEVRTHLQVLNEELQPYQLHFGYRIFDEIVAFLIASEGNDLYADRDTAFDAAVLMKVLPKFHGSRGKLEAPLKRVLAWCLSPEAPDLDTVDSVLREAETSNSAIRALDEEPYRYDRTAAKTCQMLWELYTTGFTSFS